MKRLITLGIAILIFANTRFAVSASYRENVDYLEIMAVSATNGDWLSGQHAEYGRQAKIEDMNSTEVQFTFEELYLLAKIIYAEAGSSWLSDDWKMGVGEVLLNRVASPEFPNTISEVVFQKGQYYNSDSEYFRNLNPDRLSVNLAIRLLKGERIINDNSVVFQANFPQGSGIHTQLEDELLGATYFCHSSNMDLYEKTDAEASVFYIHYLKL